MQQTRHKRENKRVTIHHGVENAIVRDERFKQRRMALKPIDLHNKHSVRAHSSVIDAHASTLQNFDRKKKKSPNRE